MYRDWGILGKADSELRRSQRRTANPGPCTGRSRRQPHGKDVYGRPLGGLSLSRPLPGRFANQPTSVSRDDGLELRNCYITASLRCAPPKNKPLPAEARNCQPYLEAELRLLTRVRAVLVLGKIAFETYVRVVASQREDFPRRSSLKFAHGASFSLPGGLPRLFCSYHSSQQNTQTGRLTPKMFQKVLVDIQEFLNGYGLGAGEERTSLPMPVSFG